MPSPADTVPVSLCSPNGRHLATIDLRPRMHEDRPPVGFGWYVRLPGIATADGYRAFYDGRSFVTDDELAAIRRHADRYPSVYSLRA